MTSTRLWRLAVLVKKQGFGWGVQSRELIKPGLGGSYWRIFFSRSPKPPFETEGQCKIFDITMTFLILMQKKAPFDHSSQRGLICTQPWQRRFLEHCQCEDFRDVLFLISDGVVCIMSSKCWAKIAGIFTLREPIPPPPPRELFCAC